MITPEQTLRYSRQIALPEFGNQAQEKLLASSVLIIGAGGLGSPIALYLAAAGVGHIAIADGDTIDTSNLQRQIIHTAPEAGTSKALSAAKKMRSINPDIEVEPIERYLTGHELLQTIARFDFVIDATDSPTAKHAIDRACLEARKAFSHGAISAFEGHTMTVVPGSTRFTDLFPAPPDTSSCPAPVGPLGPVAGIIGSIQAAEAIKYLTGIGTLLTDRLLKFDLLTMKFRTIKLASSPTP